MGETGKEMTGSSSFLQIFQLFKMSAIEMLNAQSTSKIVFQFEKLCKAKF
jgi:hypothetical protein